MTPASSQTPIAEIVGCGALVAMLARWRDMATEEIYQMEDNPERREYHRGQASGLCMAANMLEAQIGRASLATAASERQARREQPTGAGEA
jgi:hypothetical protein